MKIKINPRNLLGFIIALLTFSLLVTVARNFRGSSPEELFDALPKNVDVSLKGIDYTETRDGIQRWHLLADTADYNVKADRTLVKNVFMTFFDEQGEKTGTLSARSGEIRTESKEVSVQGEVVVESVRGYAFHSERLDYADATRTISTDIPIRMVSEKLELTGTGLRFNVDTHAYQILSKVRARLQGDENP